MKNIFLIIAIALVSTSAMAHNPLTAKFELNTSSQEVTILNVYLSQTGLHQAMIKFYTETDFETISETEYKKLAVLYVKKHTAITADDVDLIIGEGGIKLGSHQTDLKFIIENCPKNPSALNLTISAFKENSNHHSVFWWKKSDGKIKTILSPSNEYQSSLGAGDKNTPSMIGEFGVKKLGAVSGVALCLLILGGLVTKNKLYA